MGQFDNSYESSFSIAEAVGWLTVDPMQGSNNGTLAVTAQAHTGRLVRSKQIRAFNNSLQDFCMITQLGKPEFITVSSLAVESSATSVTIPFVSNAISINVDYSGGFIGTLPATYLINGQAVPIGEPIPGDPGTIQQFTGELT